MSSHGEASGVKGSSWVGGRETEDASEESCNNKTYTPCFKAVRRRLRNADPGGEGWSSSAERLVRPGLPGQKAHQHSFSKDSRGRLREINKDREEERLNAERVVGTERGKQRQRRNERTGTSADGAQDRQGRGRTESMSDSNSDIQLNNVLEAGEGSNLQRGQMYLRPQSKVCTPTTSASLHPQSLWPTSSTSSTPPQPPIQTRSRPLSPQRPSSRTAAGELYPYSFSPSREPDPFWVEVRAGGGRSSQSHHPHQTRTPSLTSSELLGEEEEAEEEEEDGEAGGSGVMEVMSQTMTSAAAPSCIPLGERKMSKRERNRIKCLRRRQRRRERWRQSQLQESRQVAFYATVNPEVHISITSVIT